MHIQKLFTVAAILAIGAMALPAPKPSKAALQNADVFSRAVNEESGAVALEDMRHKREEHMSLDKSYEGIARFKRADQALADKSYEGIARFKRADQALADKSYEGGYGTKKRNEGAASDQDMSVYQREEHVSPDKSYEGIALGKGYEGFPTLEQIHHTGSTGSTGKRATADESYNGELA